MKKGALLNFHFTTVPVFVKGPQIPHSLEISVSGMEMGDKVMWSQIDWSFLPKGVTIENLYFRKSNFIRLGIKDLIVVSLSGNRQANREEAEEVKAAEAVAAATPAAGAADAKKKEAGKQK